MLKRDDSNRSPIAYDSCTALKCVKPNRIPIVCVAKATVYDSYTTLKGFASERILSVYDLYTSLKRIEPDRALSVYASHTILKGAETFACVNLCCARLFYSTRLFYFTRLL